MARLQELINKFVLASCTSDLLVNELWELATLLIDERKKLMGERDSLGSHLARTAIGRTDETVQLWNPNAEDQEEFFGYWLVHCTELTQLLLRAERGDEPKAEAEDLDDEHCKEDPRKEPEEDEDDPEGEGKEEPEEPAEKAPFSVGDYVYIDRGGSIGRITGSTNYKVGPDDGSWKYDVEYCQGKDLETGPRGGYGSVWREGYPKPVENDPADVLYVAAMHEKELHDRLDKEAGKAAKRFAALKESRRILLANSKRKEGEED